MESCLKTNWFLSQVDLEYYSSIICVCELILYIKLGVIRIRVSLELHFGQ